MRCVLEGGIAAGPEGGRVWPRMEAAGGRAGQLETNNGRGTGFEGRTITKDETAATAAQPHSPYFLALPSPCVASPECTGDSRLARKFFLKETDFLHRRVFLMQGWEIHPLSFLNSPSGVSGSGIR